MSFDLGRFSLCSIKLLTKLSRVLHCGKQENGLKSAILIGIAVLGISCWQKTTPAGESKPVKVEAVAMVDYAKQKYTPATVIDMSGLDGCVFMLKLENGKKLQPSPALTDDYSVNDMTVWVKYYVKKGAVGICMSGQIVTITDIQKR